MHVVTVTFEVRDEEAERFLARVRLQASESLSNEDDCHQFDVCTDPLDPCRIFLYELYTDAAAFDAHLASAHFKAFDAEVSPWVVKKSIATWELH
ncbi:MAG: putative quinol monooxygenase [Pseudomonadota bacterium]